MPSTKSVGLLGTGSESQRSWFGVVGIWSKGDDLKSLLSIGSNGLWRTLGLVRYVHVRSLRSREAVNAVPENCSAYSPNGARCGEFRPTGSAPATASVANSFPKPVWYLGSISLSAVRPNY